MSFISGAYSATWGGQPLGMVEGGFTLTYSKLGHEVFFDGLGRTLIDDIYMGIDMSVSFVLSEMDLVGVNDLLWDVPGAFSRGDLGNPGYSSAATSKALTLTACGSVDPQAIPASITFFRTSLKNGHEVQLAFTNRHRKASVALRVYPSRKPDSFCQYRYFEAT
jgi:hypothetical protein